MKMILCWIIVAALPLMVNLKSYTLDKNHSRLTFSATHFGISHVEGVFKDFDAKLKSEKDDFSDAQVEMTAQVNSINTDIEMRDKDLKSPNWFDADKYPTLVFKSTSFKKGSDNKYVMKGDLTMHGVTKPATFDVTYNGKATNPMSKKSMAGFTITGTLKRSDFQIGPESFTTVGDEVEVRSNVEFIMD
jgi:polyisoprenoid-binding protein YceI